jgi:hypothetical protein
MVATLVPKYGKEVAPVVGLAQSEFGGSLKSDGRFRFYDFGRNQNSVAMKMFSYSIYLKIRFYKYCAFNAIFKDNTAINFINCSCEKDPFPLTLARHTL